MNNRSEDGKGWHLDKRVSLTHIITTFGLVLSAVVWTSSVDKRVEANAIAIGYNSKRHDELKQDIKSELKHIRESVDKLVRSEGKR